MEPVLRIESLKKHYGRSENKTKALNGITFQVMSGEFLGIMGSSGSGKSTLLNCIASVIASDSGEIFIKGRQINNLGSGVLWHYTFNFVFSRLLCRKQFGGRQSPAYVYWAALVSGVLLLTGACILAASGMAWQTILYMDVTLLSGLLGMILFFVCV